MPSRNDRGSLASGNSWCELAKQSTFVRGRPAGDAPVVTQLVTQRHHCSDGVFGSKGRRSIGVGRWLTPVLDQPDQLESCVRDRRIQSPRVGAIVGWT